MGQYHHFLGMHIRNEWGLWAQGPLVKYFNIIGIYHADDMSGIILESYWRDKHNLDLDIDGQVKRYRAYWKKTTGNEIPEGYLTSA